MLDDGTYDALIVDAEQRDPDTVACEVTILGGVHKGDVVTVIAALDCEPLDLLAVPATLTVLDGQPNLVMET